MVKKMRTSSPPVVSVIMITYNHEQYLEDAILGVLMQECDFEVELIIADDNSPDKTEIIARDIANRHPNGNWMSYFKHEQNKGMISNFIWALQQGKGDYLALCEGDDFWTDPHKLQKQVDFLEANPAYEMCFSNIQVVNSNGKTIKDKLIVNSRESIFEHKDMPVWAPTLTRVFRNRNFNILNMPCPGMDTLMLVYQSTLGKIKFLDEITGSYRIHGAGAYNRLNVSRQYDHKIRTSMACLNFVEDKYKRKFVGKILKDLLELKVLDIKLYKETLDFMRNEDGLIKMMPGLNYFYFLVCIYLIKLPMPYKNLNSRKALKQIINNLLVYS